MAPERNRSSQDRLVVVESLELAEPKTRDLVSRLQELGLDNVLIVVEQYADNLCLAARNLSWVDVLDLRELNLVSLIQYGKVLATAGALKALEEQLS